MRLKAAMDRLIERKDAAQPGRASAGVGGTSEVSTETFRLLLAGTGLDLHELLAAALATALAVEDTVERRGFAERNDFQNAWMDGVLTGVLFAQMEAEERRGAEA